MKKAMYGITVIAASLFTISSFANEKYDLKCTLDTGKEMTVSHSINTVYIGLKTPRGDSKEEDVIKLDIPSGEARQLLSDSGHGQVIYGLRGDNSDREYAVIIQYTKRRNEVSTYFSKVDKAGNEASKSYCKPDTITVNETLTQKGISGVKFID